MDPTLRTSVDALPNNVDATYPDRDAVEKLHQQHHDVIHQGLQQTAGDVDGLTSDVAVAQDTATAAREAVDSHVHAAPHAKARVVISFTQTAASTPPLTDFMPRPDVNIYMAIYGLFDNPEGVLDADIGDLIYKANGGAW